MTTAPRTSSAPRRAARPLLPALALAAALTLPAPARAADPPPPVFGVGFSSSKIFKPLEWALGSQRRMLQVATVGICFALWIMMKK